MSRFVTDHANEIRVKVADFAVGRGDVLISTIGLGSCVAIALYDPESRIGGLAHILLPSEGMSPDAHNRAKFPATAVPLIRERMRALGAHDARIRAKIAGGASMFANLLPTGGLNMGERNVVATRSALERAGIPIVGQDVGGECGRSIYFFLESGELHVRSLKKGDVVL